MDYELFGDGSGCLNACVLKPAERMMRIAERLNAPITFFAEVLEFTALSAHDHDSRAPDQLRNSLLRGHDVQLHLHPQWHNATRNPKGDWQLDMKRW
ncbi:MAG TPA: hypothetical protein EYP34_03370, partial [Chromatiaceae bacterium]|nr:hypothetical protein [Chromatiaceae bacterium]